jgi:hypothetical protein
MQTLVGLSILFLFAVCIGGMLYLTWEELKK